MTILEALADPHLFAPMFQPLEAWAAWRVFLGAAFGLPLGDGLETFRCHTGRSSSPLWPVPREAWVVVGRRGGKSRISALIAVYLAAFKDYSGVLAPGEHATIPIIATDRQQARTVLGYVRALPQAPLLRTLIDRETAEGIALTNRVRIEVHTASWRSIRGYTVAAAVLDEVAFWRSDDSANPDAEIVNALRPAMATVPGALLVAISSPYSRRGVLWEQYHNHYAQDDDRVLVWQGDTQSMNPVVDQAVITEAYERDAVAASAEYGAEFRRDIESFVSREAIDACLVPGRLELPPTSSFSYFAFVDPSGGSADSMTLAIAHHENGHAVLDALREFRPPFSPEAVVADCAALLKTYKVSEVVGDRYAGEWPREQFGKLGLTYVVSEKVKSDIYRDALPLLNSSRVELLDHRRLVAQLLGLERRTARGGRDSIDHGPRGHDDVANAACGVLLAAAELPGSDTPVRAGGTRMVTEVPRLRREDMPL
jgi:hypothetical protein